MASDVPTTHTSGQMETRSKEAVERERMQPGLIFRPEADILERPEEFVVLADLPGVDEQNVDVRLEDGVLSIDARLSVQPDVSWTPLACEYRLGGYHREFALSEGIDAQEISASMRDGVLELHLPKARQLQPRTIPVRTG